jgi:hypothetical protein
VDDKLVDLPHWVLSAMKCLANWPKQMRTANGKESGLPTYAGFENDVFNVVKDYFLGLPGPLTTYPLYEFFIDAFIKAEAISSSCIRLGGVNKGLPGPPTIKQELPLSHRQPPVLSVYPCCQNHPVQTIGGSQQQQSHFYQMTEDGRRSEEEFPGLLSSQERVARIKQTFQAGLRIRINLSCWILIRIRIQIADPDPGGQKCPTKIE